MLLQLRQARKKAYHCTWKGKRYSRAHLLGVQCCDLNVSLGEVEMMGKRLKHEWGTPKPRPGLANFLVSTALMDRWMEYNIPWYQALCSGWIRSSFSSPLPQQTQPVGQGHRTRHRWWKRPLWLWQLCHDCDTWSTLYHSVWSHPHVYRPFHCMYLHSPIISVLLVLPLISECFVWSIFPYDYLICFCLQSRLLSVPILLYLLIRYTSGNRPQTSLGLLITLHELRWSSACPTPRASPCTFYSSI